MRGRLPAVLWLTCVWVLLWGTFTPASIVGGLVVAVLVTALFRLPPATDRLPVRPLRMCGLVLFLLWDIAVSGVEVSWEVLRHGPRARGVVRQGARRDGPVLLPDDLLNRLRHDTLLGGPRPP